MYNYIFLLQLLDCKTSSSSNQEELCTNISLMDIVIRKSSSNGGGGKTNVRLRVYPKDSGRGNAQSNFNNSNADNWFTVAESNWSLNPRRFRYIKKSKI